MYLSKDALLARTQRAERDESSAVLGGVLRLRELSRLAWREASTFAAIDELTLDLDRYHAAIFAGIVVDPESKEALFMPADVLAWVQGADLWAEVRRIAEAGLAMSEIGPGFREASGAAPDAE